jgi:uncharacterized protein YkwD
MRSRLLTIATLSAALLIPAAAAHAADCPGQDLVPDATNTAQVTDATLCLLNDQRAANGLAPLAADDRLNSSSTDYANLMIAEQFFAHESPEGVTLETRLARVGYSFDIAGENIAWGEGALSTPAQIVDAWMHSEGHRENILDGDFRQIGLGVVGGLPIASSIGGATYVTDFGTAAPAPAPRSAPQRATLAVNATGNRSADPVAHYAVKRSARKAAAHRKAARKHARRHARRHARKHTRRHRLHRAARHA